MLLFIPQPYLGTALLCRNLDYHLDCSINKLGSLAASSFLSTCLHELHAYELFVCVMCV